MAVLLAGACDSEDNSAPNTPATGGHAGAGHGGTSARGGSGGRPDPSEGGSSGAGSGGTAGNASAGSGAGGEPGGAPSAGSGGEGASSGLGGASSSGGASGAAGDESAGGLGSLVENGAVAVAQRPRPDFGALVVATDGDHRYVVESRRFIEPGPFDLPWRSGFRLAAYDDDELAWSYAAPLDDAIGDVVVHPSGDVTISLQRQEPEENAYQLIRLNSAGEVLGVTTLQEPATAPDTDYAEAAPRPLFLMKADLADATSAGWVTLLPDGDGVTAAVLSHVRLPGGVQAPRLALALMTYTWSGGDYVERWSRVVDGVHAAQPAAWAYDEFRWREQAIRPFLARDASTDQLVVGRAWNSLRCEANVSLFAEFSARDCVFGAVGPAENELLPLAVTRFDAAGHRLGTKVIATDPDAPEQVPFALAARDGQLAVAGAVVRQTEDGSRRTYPDAKSYVDYDGYIALYDREGQPLLHHDFNQGRGDVLAALRWTDAGIVAVGASGWDRWQGGMSVSRGADPLIAWLSTDGGESAARVIALSDGSRHFTLHDLVVDNAAIRAYGFADGPMTHSADGNNTAARTFGPLLIRIAEP